MKGGLEFGEMQQGGQVIAKVLSERTRHRQCGKKQKSEKGNGVVRSPPGDSIHGRVGLEKHGKTDTRGGQQKMQHKISKTQLNPYIGTGAHGFAEFMRLSSEVV